MTPLRRYPHLTRDDKVLLTSLPPDDARAAEQFIRGQFDADKAYREHHVPEADLPEGGFTRLLDTRMANAVGFGGGRRRRAYAGAD